MAESEKNDLEMALKKEVGTSAILAKLQLVKSELPLTGCDKSLMGTISTLAHKLHPNCHYNSVNIYQTLMDDLRRKGKTTFDYIKWDDMLKNKALTNTQVQETITIHTKLPDEEDPLAVANDLIKDMNLSTIEKHNLKKACRSYYTNQLIKTSRVLRIKEDLKKIIFSTFDELNDKKINTWINDVEEKISADVCDLLGDQSAVHAAIICELGFKLNED
ncbi:DUF4297 domain-containing protein [Zooshikella sp. WH53]|uniref:DUF4297 domain-containing protein n=1 Tax=Zooshikella harenae TaxID=2827238 RepID=A0ABS5ZK68_9GAMM|nr:dsDNA nuclease domain-containing protein [Zooshikella harenae]MBU2714422.1 DUF4297 domain-containing protein [Zooshikella harenae]